MAGPGTLAPVMAVRVRPSQLSEQLFRRMGVPMKRIAFAIMLALGLTSAVVPEVEAGGLPLTTVTCGFPVTESIKVANSIFGCQLDGLKVMVDDITIDLNGRTIDGNDADNSLPDYEAGVDTGNHSGVTVKNGTLTDFEGGVIFGTGTNNRVVAVTASSGGAGFDLDEGSGTTIENSTASRNSVYGFSIDGADHTLRGNTASASGTAPASGAAYKVEGANHVIAGNKALDSHWLGFYMPSVTNTTLRNNTASGGGDDGFSVNSTYIAGHNTLIGNKAINNYDTGFRIESGVGNDVVKNNVAKANYLGFDLGAEEMLFETNIASGNITNGVQVSDTDSVLRDNKSSGNLLGGFYVQGSGQTLKNNEAIGNGAHGIEVTASNGHRVVSNTADRNGFLNGEDQNGLGIKVAAGATNFTAAKNDAKDNADPAECSPTANCNT